MINKKICIFASHYFPYLGGVENYTYNLAKSLMIKGNEVVIVTSNDMNLASYEKMDEIPVFRLPCFNLLAGRFPISKVNREYKKLYQELMQTTFDLVIVQTRFYPHSVAGMRFAKKQGCQCITIDHGTSHMTIGSKFWDTLGACYEHVVTAIEKRLCQDYYGVSADCCNWLSHFGIKAKGILYNAIDNERIQALLAVDGRDFRQEQGIEEDTVVITYTGRLVKEKGIMKLIEAILQYNGQQKICLMIAGDGEEMAAVMQATNERIIPLGRLNFEEIIALLKQTQIFCLPTDYPEGFPTSTLEAAVAGCYIITTPRGSSRELLIDSSYGIIMKDNASDTILRSLNEAIALGANREVAIERTRAYVLGNFTWNIVSQQVHEIGDSK